MFKDVLQLIIQAGYYVTIKGYSYNISGEHLQNYHQVDMFEYRGCVFSANLVSEIRFHKGGVEISLV